MKNKLILGDAKVALEAYVEDSSIDLIYADPPFCSQTDYLNKNGVLAFADTWQWNTQSDNLLVVIKSKNPQLGAVLSGLLAGLGKIPLLAYLVDMAPILINLHQVLSVAGSLYLHCDTVGSHYLKLLLDVIFGVDNFINEISWQRSNYRRSSISKVYTRIHDRLLFYTKSCNYTFNMQYMPLNDTTKRLYKFEDERGKFQKVTLLVSGRRNGVTGEVWRGIDPNIRGKSGMHWITTPSNLDKYDAQGLVVWPKKSGGVPRLKYYLSDSPGAPLGDLWLDIPAIGIKSTQVGYPTQKPEELLRRVILASSNPGDTILDPFCGSGTALVSAHNLDRKWIGIDKSSVAIDTVVSRFNSLGVSLEPLAC